MVNSRSEVGSNFNVESSVGKYELINVHLIFRFCGKHAEMEFCKYLENNTLISSSVQDIETSFRYSLPHVAVHAVDPDSDGHPSEGQRQCNYSVQDLSGNVPQRWNIRFEITTARNRVIQGDHRRLGFASLVYFLLSGGVGNQRSGFMTGPANRPILIVLCWHIFEF